MWPIERINPLTQLKWFSHSSGYCVAKQVRGHMKDDNVCASQYRAVTCKTTLQMVSYLGLD